MQSMHSSGSRLVAKRCSAPGVLAPCLVLAHSCLSTVCKTGVNTQLPLTTETEMQVLQTLPHLANVITAQEPCDSPSISATVPRK